MTISARVVRENDWGVLLIDNDKPVMLVDADTAIKLGIHLIILGQDALHGKALEMVCMDKSLPPDTFVDLWQRIDQYITILNSAQKDIDDSPE